MLLEEKLKDWELILGSRSPRRRDLLAACGFDFSVEDYQVEEIFPADMASAEVPVFLAHLKSDGYPNTLSSNQILITADTVVILEGQVIGKPKDRDDAMSILARLSGKAHTVVTGVVLRSGERRSGFSVSTHVRFRPLRGEEIEYYVDNFAPYDKAGAYAIQEWIGYVGLEGIEGSFYNVMGLPVQALYVRLDRFIDGKLWQPGCW